MYYILNKMCLSNKNVLKFSPGKCLLTHSSALDDPLGEGCFLAPGLGWVSPVRCSHCTSYIPFVTFIEWGWASHPSYLPCSEPHRLWEAFQQSAAGPWDPARATSRSTPKVQGHCLPVSCSGRPASEQGGCSPPPSPSSRAALMCSSVRRLPPSPPSSPFTGKPFITSSFQMLDCILNHIQTQNQL